ncbi:MAG: hypothetical protein DELT_00269 [Desulfovibrio sp.]
MRMPKILMTVLVAALPLALTVAFAGAAFSHDVPPIFAAKEFWQKFEDDRPKAEAEFIGKTMSYTGVVVETGMSIYMTPNVRLSDSPDGPVYLICVLPRADVGKLSEYKKGDQVTMTGRVYRSRADGGVVVKECRRADPPTSPR